jgi:hypothetical protein
MDQAHFKGLRRAPRLKRTINNHQIIATTVEEGTVTAITIGTQVEDLVAMAAAAAATIGVLLQAVTLPPITDHSSNKQIINNTTQWVGYTMTP